MKIILACDQESFNQAIAEFVIEHPWPAQSKFRIVNVVPPIYDYAYAASVPELMMDLREDARNQAQIRIRNMALKLRDHFHLDNIEEFILEGNPAEKILDTASEWKADLIIMGSHARTGLNKLLMGSVSSAVLDHAGCSVIIVRDHIDKKQTDKESRTKVEARA
ncbi:MAG: universal stress protein [Candidatus Melainabacteria bacterium]|nr:universal stress protein [Candidatus Melainabacteria bacterium]